jgi:L-threonylcarbamoyladenylate synthase
LERGGLVAFPTETVYGLGADASNPHAVQRVYEVKRRPSSHPLIVHLGWAEAAEDWAADLSEDARRLARAFWPGPLTLLVRRAARVPDVVTGGGDRVGLRVPDHPLALELLDMFGGGIAAPSANRFGRVSPTTAAHVRADLGTDVDVVLDGGPTRVGLESTIVDCTTTDVPEVVRPGGVTFEALERALGRPAGVWLGDRELAAPGTLPAHYAPHASVRVVERVDDAIVAARAALERGESVAVLAPAFVPGLPPGALQLEPAGDADRYARVLYERLRAADAQGVAVLITIPPGQEGIGRAVRDRLERAAASAEDGS